MDMFAYFALSVVWRSTHAWPTQDGYDTKPLSLGQFREPVREFLVGATVGFPRDVAVLVIVCNDQTSRQSWFLPTQTDDVRFHDIKFLAFGVTFRVVLGKSIPAILRADSCHEVGKRIHVGNCRLKTVEAFRHVADPSA